MNILYICPRFPYPADQGDKVVVYNHLKFLSKENKITLLSFIQDKKELEGISHLSNYCSRIEVFKRRPNLSILNFIYVIYKTEPFTVIRYYSPRMFRRAKELIESGKFDVAHVAFYYMGQYMTNKNIKIPKNTATILDTHNIEYLVYSRYARLTRNPFLKLVVKLESLRIQKYELLMYKKFDRCIAFSELDRKNILMLSSSSNIVVNPAYIELPAINEVISYQDEPRTKTLVRGEEKDTVLFFGLLNTLANEDAIRFFYEKIFPLLKRQMPNVKFIIAGKHPTKYVTNLAKDANVRLVGLVPNMRDLLKSVALVIVPLRLGGGIRLKILESWTAGKCVVSTSIGAEGVEAKDGEDIIIADSISDFVNAVIGLLKDDVKRNQIGQAGFKKVCEYYNPERIIRNLERIYRETLEEKSKL